LLRRVIRGRSRKVDEARQCAAAMRAWRAGPPAPRRHPFLALACIGCGMEGDGAYSFAEDHPCSIDVGPFCSQCFEGIKDMVLRWNSAETLGNATGGPR